MLAHVDAGKTSLTEALLHTGGALAELGSVDAGTTQTDTLQLERRRGITIRAAVASFAVDDVTVNIVDTPGHPDFITEVDRSLAVLDAAVLVVSAVEGVQAQTVVLYRALCRRGVPMMIVINKIDRAGADPGRVVGALRRRLGPVLVLRGAVEGPGTPVATYRPHTWERPEDAEAVTAQLAENDDAVLREWIDTGQPATPPALTRALRAATQRGTAHPVLFTSARTGAGVGALVDDLVGLFTSQTDPTGADVGVDAGPVSSGGVLGGGAGLAGQVFAVERAPDGDRVCLLRLRAGSIAVRQHVDLPGGRSGTVTALEVYEPGGPVTRASASAGQIVRVHGLTSAKVGDGVGRLAGHLHAAAFPPPSLRTAVSATDPARQQDLHRALTELADADPPIRVRTDPHRGALVLDVYGAVQQEVIADALAANHDLDVRFSVPTTICVERPARRASAACRMQDPGHTFGCTVELAVEPAAPGSEVQMQVSADRSGLPLHVYGSTEDYRTAVLGYLEAPLSRGPLGWPVTDVLVTITGSGYPPAGPAAADVRGAVALATREAVRRAGTVGCEPINRFHLEVPTDSIAATLALLAHHRATPDAVTTHPAGLDAPAVLTGVIPAAELDALRAGLSTAAHGEALLESRLDHYAPVPSGQR